MMILKQTMLEVVDNSGAKEAQCIGMYKGKKEAKVGDVVLVTVRKLNRKVKNNTIKKGQIFKAVICRTVRKYNRGLYTFNYSKNAVILMNNELKKSVGNRASGCTIRLNKDNNKIHKEQANIFEKIV